MAKINKITDNIPLKMRMRANSVKRQMKKNGCKNIVVSSNKKGEVAVLAYGSPEHDELVMSNIIKPDGKETFNIYRIKKNLNGYTKIIETWDRIKNNLIFNKVTRFNYKNPYSIPESVTITYTDANLDDGVKIIRKFPLEKYMEKFKRPQA